MHFHASQPKIKTSGFLLNSRIRFTSLFLTQENVSKLRIRAVHTSAERKVPKQGEALGHFERRAIQRPEGFERLRASRSVTPRLLAPARSQNSSKIAKDAICPDTVPTTPWQLVQRLRLLALPPAPPFSHFVNLHRKYPHLHSIESYNFLMALSIRHGLSNSTRTLIDSMAAMHIEPNVETEKLVVRYLVSSGFWTRAWRQVMTRYGSVRAIPIPVLLELLAPSPRDHLRPRLFSRAHRIYARPSPRLVKESVTLSQTLSKEPLDPTLLISHRFPKLALSDLAQLPTRVVSYMVRQLINCDRQDEALVITRNHIMALPRHLTSKRLNFARSLINMHLSTGQIKLVNFKKKRKLVESLFALHPDLGPNAQTTSLLMRFMAKSKQPGTHAYYFYKSYRSRWGSVVDSLSVRRRVVQYALKQKRLDIAHEIATMEPPKIPSYPIEQPGSRDQLLDVPEWRVMYPRYGRERRYWKRVMYRLLHRRRSAAPRKNETTSQLSPRSNNVSATF